MPAPLLAASPASALCPPPPPEPSRPVAGATARPSRGTPQDAHPDEAFHPEDLRALDLPEAMSDCSRGVIVGGLACQESLFILQNLRCAACGPIIERALLGCAGVVSARVQLVNARLRVVWNPAQVLPSSLVATVQQAGYKAVPARSLAAETARRATEKQALWRLLVAAFCMMQVMMYAVPAYYINPGEISREIDLLLRWAGWFLTLPVLLFSCQPFFAGALAGLRQGRISMDFPVALGIVITFVAGTAASFAPEGTFGGDLYFDSLTMFVCFLLAGRWLEQQMKSRTAGALEAIIERLPEQVWRISSQGVKNEMRVSLRQLQVGDVVRVLAGQAFPGDGMLIDQGADVDEALLTGEARPVSRAAGDTVIAGSYNLSGPVLVALTRLGEDTRFGQMVTLMETAAREKPRLAQLADRVAGPFLLAVLLSAALAAGFWWWHDPALAPALPLKIAVAVLIVTCPCALSLATPAALLAAAGSLARRGILVRRLQAIETLAQAEVFAFDKTGTLTSDTPSLLRIDTRIGLDEAEALRLAGALASQSLHPLARALHALGANSTSPETASPTPNTSTPIASMPLGPIHLTHIQETPGAGLTGHAEATGTLRLGSAAHAGVADAADGAASCYLADETGFLARFVFSETIKPGAADALTELRKAGRETWLLSGDQPAAVAAVARQVGAGSFRAAQSPAQKRACLQAAQAKGKRVVMVGDGLNDGPVLAQADVSITLGRAAPLAQSRADFIVLSGNPADVIWARQLAVRTLRILKQNLGWAAAYNLLCVPLAVAGLLPPWLAGLGMALSSLAVVGNALRLARATAQPTRQG